MGSVGLWKKSEPDFSQSQLSARASYQPAQNLFKMVSIFFLKPSWAYFFVILWLTMHTHMTVFWWYWKRMIWYPFLDIEYIIVNNNDWLVKSSGITSIKGSIPLFVFFAKFYNYYITIFYKFFCANRIYVSTFIIFPKILILDFLSVFLWKHISRK